MRSAGREFLRLCGVAIVVGGLAAALTLLVVPLSVQRAPAGAVMGYCGPGYASDNAVQVRLQVGDLKSIKSAEKTIDNTFATKAVQALETGAPK